MMQLNRHVVGVSAIMVALVALGYAANTETNRRVASLPEATVAIARNDTTEQAWDRNFLAQLKRVPPNAYGSARGSEETLGQKIKSGITAILPAGSSNSAQTESKSWSDEEWQIAEKAVADLRGASKAGNNNNASARSDTVWQPPQEIVNRDAEQSR